MKLLSYILCVFFLASCGSSTKKKIHDQVLAETQVKDGASLNKTAQQLVDESPTLTPDQKKELSRIIEEIKIKNQALSEESFKYRGVLMRELISGKSTASEIKIIKKQLSKIERQRLSNTIQMAKQITQIVDGEEETERILDSVIFREGRSF